MSRLYRDIERQVSFLPVPRTGRVRQGRIGGLAICACEVAKVKMLTPPFQRRCTELPAQCCRNLFFHCSQMLSLKEKKSKCKRKTRLRRCRMVARCRESIGGFQWLRNRPSLLPIFSPCKLLSGMMFIAFQWVRRLFRYLPAAQR